MSEQVSGRDSAGPMAGGARNYRALMAVVIILGALIMLALGALIAGLVLRAGARAPALAAQTAPETAAAVPAAPAAVPAPKPPFKVDIHTDDRSQIVDAQVEGDRLLVRLQTAYGQELVILDANDGHEIGRVGVGLPYPDSP